MDMETLQSNKPCYENVPYSDAGSIWELVRVFEETNGEGEFILDGDNAYISVRLDYKP